ncbi:hypothetical protein DFO45_1725 [Azorhizobium sp. AG788]|uniref:hypothetical protein n=1 Tax=Azorhizobium sp. AG788 TaxID=2183897 RepID=UPI00105F895C|nr:hypothetical protein [Azorhizobium sp. AG788]TDT96532.1 hypothetical protein DFO45_1725 [Azorhizobium sp. AG788]
MRNLSYAALALVAGLSLTSVAQADEYTTQEVRDQYAVAAESAAHNQPLLPFTAQATARTAASKAQAPAATQDAIVGPFSDKDAHSGPAHFGIPSRL